MNLVVVVRMRCRYQTYEENSALRYTAASIICVRRGASNTIT